MADKKITGAEILIKALKDQGVETIFGYPGGTVLPIYDALFKQNDIQHILVRQEGGAVHAAEGYARSTGKVGVVLVTSGPGATNAVTGLTDAMLDSIPIICITGQVPTALIGNDAFQEADITGITRPSSKHNYLVKDTEKLAHIIHEAFYVATTGRPGPVVIDLPKDVQVGLGDYVSPKKQEHKSYRPRIKPDIKNIKEAVLLMKQAKKPLFYCGGGIISSTYYHGGINASEKPNTTKLLSELVHLTNFPITLTLMGLGAFPASDDHNLGMLGMHGTYEANNAMYESDLIICIGARFDDRITSRLDTFAPFSQKIQIDIDPSSINKNVAVDIAIVGDAGLAIQEIINLWKEGEKGSDNKPSLNKWWKQIAEWREEKCLEYPQSDKIIKPQHAIERLCELTKGKNTYVTTEVGQHQMWSCHHFKHEKTGHWISSGGLGTMGFGLPAAIGVQVGNPKATVCCIAGESSLMMNIQELSTAVQHKLPIKIMVLNNMYMGMVRQWQELLYNKRYSQSFLHNLPDLVKLCDAFGAEGLKVENPKDLDNGIKTMLAASKPFILTVVVDPEENCYPMIPPGETHNKMLLYKKDKKEKKCGKCK